MVPAPESDDTRATGPAPARHLGLPPPKLDALRAVGINLAGTTADPTGDLQGAAGQAAWEELRRAALTETQAATAFGVPTDNLRELVTNGQVAAVEAEDGGWLFPAWQFPDGHPLPGLAQVCQAAVGVCPVTVAAFMAHPDVDLEVDGTPVSPAVWLAAGGEPGVVADLLAGLQAHG